MAKAKLDCLSDLVPRVSYTGNYEQHECSITITGLQREDAGEWSCEVNSNMFKGLFDLAWAWIVRLKLDIVLHCQAPYTRL